MPCPSVERTVMEEFSTSLNHLPLLRSSHWSNHNFCLPQLPKAPSLDQVQGKYKDSRVKLQLEEMIGQMEDKYLATAVCGDQLVLWDQHNVHKRIRLEGMMVSTLTPGDSHSGLYLWSVLFWPVFLPRRRLAVFSRSDDCALQWGWWGQSKPPPSS